MLDSSRCKTPGCNNERYNRKELCKRCCDKYVYRHNEKRLKANGEIALPYDQYLPARNVAEKGEIAGTVKVDGLTYKIGVMGKAFYFADQMWKLSNRSAKWIAEQIAKAENQRGNGSV